MPTYLTPGVYVEEIPSGSRPIEGVATSVAAFIGVAERGPLFKPVAVTKIDEFRDSFGGFLPPGTDGTETGKSYLAHAVNQFFNHGGSSCFIVRVAEDRNISGVTRADSATGHPLDPAYDFLSVVEAAYKDAPNPGNWAKDHYTVRITPSRSDPASRFDLEVRFWTTLADIGREGVDEDNYVDGPIILESYTDLSHSEDSPDYGPTVVNDASRFIKIDIESSHRGSNAGPTHDLYDPAQPEGSKDIPESYQLRGAGDLHGDPVGDSNVQLYEKALKSLDVIKDVRLIAIPGVYEQAMTGVKYCDNRPEKDCVFFMDAPEDKDEPSEIIEWADGVGATPSSYAVLYYPWVKAANFGHKGGTDWFPPSAFVMGMCGRIDKKRGVWKAPAGLETALAGVRDVKFELTDKHQESLNPRGINCLRVFKGMGTVIWGTRTRSTRADPEWRYLPVRRTAIMIERSIFGGIQWAVFEPNDHRLWSALRANIGNFMDGLFRAGAFQGEKASDAYFVRCGLGDTMTQGDIDAGRVIVQVGFAPLKPAEFVIVRIQQKVNQK